MSSEYWLLEPDDPSVRRTRALFPHDDGDLLAAGYTPVGGIRTWIPIEEPDTTGLSGAELRIALAHRAAAQGVDATVYYRRQDGRTMVTLSDFGGVPELTTNSILTNGAFIRTLLLDDESAELMDCMDGEMFSGWPEGGLHQARIATGGVGTVLDAHDKLLAHAVLEEQSAVAPLVSVEDALVTRRLSNRMAARYGFWFGLRATGIFEYHERLAAQIAELEAAEVGWGRWLLHRAALRLLRGTLRWQLLADAHHRAGTGERLPLDQLRALPVQPATRAGAVGDWEHPDQSPYPAWSLWRRLWEGHPLTELPPRSD